MKVNPFIFPGFTLVLLLFSAFNPPHFNPKTTEKFVVVLDAGHGGHDPGNLGNGFLEKNIALGIVLAAGKVLETKTDIEVVYTRKDDRFVDLYVRGEIANKAKADLFVSIHCDSHNSDAQGAGTFVLGLHANKQNFEIAKKENSVIYLEDNYESRYAAYDINSPESIIGLTIMQEEFLDQSILLGKMMQDNFTKNLSRKDRKVKQAGFIVLHQTFMPSVLIETGFLTNKNEGTYLDSQKGQAEMGKAIADAIVLYKRNLWSESTAFEEAGENVITSVPEVQKAPDEELQEPVSESKEEEKDEMVETVEEIPQIETQAQNPDVPEPEVKEPAIAEVSEPTESERVAVEKELKSTEVPEELKPQETKTKEVAAVAGVEEVTTQKDKAVDPLANAETDTEEPESEEPEQTVNIEKTPEKPPVVAERKADETKSVPPSEAKPKVKVTFKVQILASSKEIPLQANNFRGLSTISKEPYKSLFRYMYGQTSSYEQAKLLKSNADLKGYTTSFIVAYKEGVRIPVKEAVKYSSE